MQIILTPDQYTALKKLVPIVREAQNQGATTGEAVNGSDKVEWIPTEVKFTLAQGGKDAESCDGKIN